MMAQLNALVLSDHLTGQTAEVWPSLRQGNRELTLGPIRVFTDAECDQVDKGTAVRGLDYLFDTRGEQPTEVAECKRGDLWW